MAVCVMQSPETEHNQLVKCVMKREYNSSQKRAIKYTLKLGDRLSNSTFLMTALQVSRWLKPASESVQ